MRELLLEIWTSIRRNKLRTFLTGFSVAWGIFMLVILLGSGNGLKNGVTSNFKNMAINTVSVGGGWTSMAYEGYDKWRHIVLKSKDIDILGKSLPQVDNVSASTWYDGTKCSYGKQYSDISLCGSYPNTKDLDGIEIVKGRFINNIDLNSRRKVIVIDKELETILFQGADPLGKQIRIRTTPYTVIGTFKGDAQHRNSAGYIPFSTGQAIFKANSPDVNSITMTVHGLDNDQEMKAFENGIRTRLAKSHHFDPKDESALWIENVMEMYKNMMMIFGGINFFVWMIGLGTLLAGVVGVSNIMLVTVSERTAEFGIRKALGAKPRSIIRLILTESVMITAIFGYFGMVLGVAVMEGVNYLLTQSSPTGDDGPAIFLNPTLDLGVAVSATIVLILAGLVAGYMPARRAARLKTIDALRYNK